MCCLIYFSVFAKKKKKRGVGSILFCLLFIQQASDVALGMAVLVGSQSVCPNIFTTIGMDWHK